MNKYINIFRNLFYKQNVKTNPLGRWKIENCNLKTNNKIDLSNEDHCGTCGKYAETKLFLINKNFIKK